MTRINVGDSFPEFEFDTAYKDGLNSLKILKGKTIFWVLRYIGCTVCRYDVHMIAKRYDEFIKKNAQVFPWARRFSHSPFIGRTCGMYVLVVMP